MTNRSYEAIRQEVLRKDQQSYFLGAYLVNKDELAVAFATRYDRDTRRISAPAISIILEKYSAPLYLSAMYIKRFRRFTIVECVECPYPSVSDIKVSYEEEIARGSLDIVTCEAGTVIKVYFAEGLDLDWRRTDSPIGSIIQERFIFVFTEDVKIDCAPNEIERLLLR